MPKISVIIPVYNSEKYIRECLDSVLSQTYSDFEVLIINDGSTDISGEICEEYAKKDLRISVFHKENGGVSSARNLGLEKAQGEWISFLDSDDWISNDYFKCFKEDIPNKIDWIFLNIHKNRGFPEMAVQTIFPKEIINRDKFLQNYTVHPHFFGPCAKFFRRQIIQNRQLKFDENLAYGEDSIFNCEFLTYVNKIYLYGDCFYHQREVDGSLSFAKPQLNKDRYKYERLYYILQNMKLPPDIINRNIYPSASRYLAAIINSQNTIFVKNKLGKKILKEHKEIFMEDFSKSSGKAKYLPYLLKYNLYFPLIFLLNLK